MTPKYRLSRPLRPIDRPGRERPTVLVWVDSDDYDSDGTLQLEGDPALIGKVRQTLAMSYGSRGRPLDGPLTPRDLAVALESRDFQAFDPTQQS